MAQEIDPAVKTEASRAIGLDIGMKLAKDENLDRDAVKAGFAEGIARTAELTPAEQEKMLEVVADFNKQLGAYIQKKMEAEAVVNGEAALAFLKKNAAAPGVKTLPGGIQYKVVAEGRPGAPSPKKTDIVRVHYEGKLLDGTTFDSSLTGDSPEPAVFPLNRVIDGWQIALQEMHVGDKWQIWIPPASAYGKTPPIDKIGPDSLLVFEVELLGIEKPPGAPAGGPGAADPLDAPK